MTTPVHSVFPPGFNRVQTSRFSNLQNVSKLSYASLSEDTPLSDSSHLHQNVDPDFAEVPLPTQTQAEVYKTVMDSAMDLQAKNEDGTVKTPMQIAGQTLKIAKALKQLVALPAYIERESEKLLPQEIKTRLKQYRGKLLGIPYLYKKFFKPIDLRLEEAALKGPCSVKNIQAQVEQNEKNTGMFHAFLWMAGKPVSGISLEQNKTMIQQLHEAQFKKIDDSTSKMFLPKPVLKFFLKQVLNVSAKRAERELEFIEKGKNFKDNMPALPLSEFKETVETAKASLEKQLGQPITLSETAISTASIGQVHVATAQDGTQYILKLLKPEATFERLGGLKKSLYFVNLVNKGISAEAQKAAQQETLSDLGSLQREADFDAETANAKNYHQGLSAIQDQFNFNHGKPKLNVVVPISSGEGYLWAPFKGNGTLNRADRETQSRIQSQVAPELLSLNLFYPKIHLDPHTGNLLVPAQGETEITAHKIDFGRYLDLNDTIHGNLNALTGQVLAQKEHDFFDIQTEVSFERVPEDQQDAEILQRREVQSREFHNVLKNPIILENLKTLLKDAPQNEALRSVQHLIDDKTGVKLRAGNGDADYQRVVHLLENLFIRQPELMNPQEVAAVAQGNAFKQIASPHEVLYNYLILNQKPEFQHLLKPLSEKPVAVRDLKELQQKLDGWKSHLGNGLSVKTTPLEFFESLTFEDCQKSLAAYSDYKESFPWRIKYLISAAAENDEDAFQDEINNIKTLELKDQEKIMKDFQFARQFLPLASETWLPQFERSGKTTTLSSVEKQTLVDHLIQRYQPVHLAI